MHKLSYHRYTFVYSKKLKINLLERHMLCPRILSSCLLWWPSTHPKVKAGFVVRLVVPWHPALKGFAEQWKPLLSDLSNGLIAPELGISYSLASDMQRCLMWFATLTS